MPKLPWKPWHEVVKLRDDLKSGLKNRKDRGVRAEIAWGPEGERVSPWYLNV